jgi:hypothetical protein
LKRFNTDHNQIKYRRKKFKKEHGKIVRRGNIGGNGKSKNMPVAREGIEKRGKLKEVMRTRITKRKKKIHFPLERVRTTESLSLYAE